MSLYCSNQSTHLDLLPPEVQCLILKSIPDMKTLRVLIGASPRYLQVFTTSRETILAHITCNQITPAVVSIALDALEQRERGRQRSDRTAVLAFLKESRQKNLREPLEIPLEVSKMLLQYHETVEYFISDFTINRLAVVESILPPESQSSSETTNPGRVLTLSQTESSRIARALYRLELCSHILSKPDRRGDVVAVAEQLSILLQSPSEWELEEILCVRNYLLERLNKFVSQIEDDFMQNFLEDEPHIIEPSRLDNRWNDEDFFFSYDAHGPMQEEWLETCLERDLGTLRVMLTADTSEARFDALGNTDYYHCQSGTTLAQLLGILRTHRKQEEKEDIGIRTPDAEFHDGVEKHNQGWLWARKSLARPRWFTGPPDDEVIEGLRRWGYVFWDHERLQRFGVLPRK